MSHNHRVRQGSPATWKIRIFVSLHRYRQRQILVLSESITPWATPILRVTSWLDPPSLCTTLPRYVKLFKISMSSPHAWTDCTVSSSTPPNTWTLVLAQETLSQGEEAQGLNQLCYPAPLYRYELQDLLNQVFIRIKNC